MGWRIGRALLWTLVVLSIDAGPTWAQETPHREIRFNRDIRPLLSDRCFFCHGPDSNHREADLRLDTREGIEYAVAPGDLDSSLLWDRVASADADLVMPPADSGKQLSTAEKQTLRQWILQGAPYAAHWSYVAPRRPALPQVRDESWGLNRVDRFILAELESRNLTPSPQADPVTLVRRLYFDLTGLPPSSMQVQAYLSDSRADRYERLVDTLLQSPRYGERMAMYWLDLVRYADTVGYHGDQEHNISPYRDYVIDAFNRNLPFDQFTREQLAGDLLPESTVDQKIASGYNRLLQTTHEGGAQDREYLAKYAADRVRNVSGVWMGATMGCCECHEHKYDPYTQRDFYALAAFFADVKEQGAYRAPNTSPTKREPEIPVHTRLERQRLVKLESERNGLQAQLEAARAAEPADSETAAELQDRMDQVAEQIRQLEDAKRWTMITVAVPPREIRVLPRGDWMDNSGAVVEPAIPEFLGTLDTGDRRATRLDLANWLTQPDHPQTARVFVNRLWYLFFGAGISRSLDDTGSQGELPTHPELLDDLAVEFVDSGWDIRHMVQLLVTSRCYRQSSLERAELRDLDPENRLYARQSRFRLPAEMIRDNALAASGLLVNELGGPSVRPYQPAGYYAHLNFPKRTYHPDQTAQQYRRGVYMHWQRQYLHPMLKAFDAPSREECTAARPVSNTPLAALTLLNDPTFVEAARVFAEQAMQQPGGFAERLNWCWKRCLSRPPRDAERRLMDALYQSSLAEYQANPESAHALLNVGLSPLPRDLTAEDQVRLAAWTQLCRTLLNLNETLTRN